MSRIIAIDPGFAAKGQGCACAALVGGALVRVWFARYDGTCRAAVAALRSTAQADRVVWEIPQFDRRSRAIDPTNLIKLAEAGAGLANRYAQHLGAAVVAMTPTAWKGGQEKPKHHHHLWQSLDLDEQEILGGAATAAAIEAACEKGAACRWRPGTEWYPRGFLAHNLLDAAALGKRATTL